MLLLVQYTLVFSAVLLLVALGGCFSEHSGVINLGLEGIMVIGALGGALIMRYLTGVIPPFAMVFAVLLGAILLGTAYSALLGVASIHFRADQTLVGTAMNMLGVAAATVLVKAINTAHNPDDVSSTIQYGEAKKAFLINIDGYRMSWFTLIAAAALIAALILLSRMFLKTNRKHLQADISGDAESRGKCRICALVPLALVGIGTVCCILSDIVDWGFDVGSIELNWFMPIAVLALIAASVVLYKTRFGLRLMACGEHPQAADSVGINVHKMRWAGVLISGVLGGLGGICYILAGVSEWKFENGVAGFGFLSLAVMIFGQWKPWRIGLAALLFGLFRALSNVYFGFPSLMALNIPGSVYNMMPYIISLLVLAFTSKKSRAPKAEGIPYDKGQR